MSDRAIRTENANRAVWYGVVACLIGSMFWLLFASRGHPRVMPPPSRAEVYLNQVAKAFAMYAIVEGERQFCPDHASQAVPKYLDSRFPEFEESASPSLAPWPDELVYAYGGFHFVRHLFIRCDLGNGTRDDGRDMAARLILAFGKANRQGMRHVVFVDGHTQWTDEHDFDKALALTLKTVRRDREQEAGTE